MKRIRINNDFTFAWAIERNGLPEDLSTAINMVLRARNSAGTLQTITDYDVAGNIVSVEITPEIANVLGRYNFILTYELPDASLDDMERLCEVDTDAFIIVPRTAEADDAEDLLVTSDMAIGFKGDSVYQVWLDEGNVGTEADYLASLKGDPFLYEDFTPEQLEALKVKGDAFEYSDFTHEQLEALKVKGDAFEYSDFTHEQLEALKGDTGNGIQSITLTDTVGKVKTYTITFTELTTTTFAVTDGADGHSPMITFVGTTIYVDGVAGVDLKGEKGDTGNGIQSITLLSTVGLVKTYRVTYTDNTTYDYTVTDGASAPIVQTTGTSETDVMSQKAVTDELALKVDKSTQGMKLLADYTHNTNIVLPEIQSIDYATSTVTFTAPHGITVVPSFYYHNCMASINDYTIKTNYKAVPTGLQSFNLFRIVEIISPTVLRFSNVIAGTNYVLPNADSTFVDFTKWHLEYASNANIYILIENSVAIKVVIMARSQHGQPYIFAYGNQTANENPPDIGTVLGLGTAYWERTFFIGGNGLLVSRTFGTGNTIRSAGMAKVTYDTINTWRYENITYLNKVSYDGTGAQFGNGTRILIYKLA